MGYECFDLCCLNDLFPYDQEFWYLTDKRLKLCTCKIMQFTIFYFVLTLACVTSAFRL